MVTFLRIGEMGRLGNQLFQIASTIGLAKSAGVPYAFKPWDYSNYFRNPLPVLQIPPVRKWQTVRQPNYHFEKDFWQKVDWSKDTDLIGYLQSEQFFIKHEKEIKEQFEFSGALIDKVRGENEAAFSKPIIAIHVRRGDYVGHDGYVNLPIRYYLLALEKHFPNWRKRFNILVFSDDQAYCRQHFGSLPNVFFAGGNEVEDLCLMTLCQHFILANSSFSWWGAWLGEKPMSIVIRPAKHFAGHLKDQIGEPVTLYPERWEAMDHEERLNLADVTFLIPVAYDHKDRRQNLETIIAAIQENFKTNILVAEQGGGAFYDLAKRGIAYYEFVGEYFHRTKMLNQMAEMVETEYFANYDADVLLSPVAIWEAVERLRMDGADVVYPYGGRFVRVNRYEWLQKLVSSKYDVGILANTEFPLLRRGDANSHGGAVFFNRESFLKGGGENENLVSFSPDDAERRYRFTLLGFDVQRVPGNLYHIEHFCGKNSGNKHKHVFTNRAEWGKVSRMNREELEAYVETWAWNKSKENG